VAILILAAGNLLGDCRAHKRIAIKHIQRTNEGSKRQAIKFSSRKYVSDGQLKEKGIVEIVEQQERR
jgi:hypothetical protein